MSGDTTLWLLGDGSIPVVLVEQVDIFVPCPLSSCPSFHHSVSPLFCFALPCLHSKVLHPRIGKSKREAQNVCMADLDSTE